ncbi:hypothetical protein KC660_01155 [Candidatus Dojkabacteria bacterium]|uniref:Uncharacterized protein n=1 Tax=Candidatus Dojkabacteria bacterium TaxID=2099670 RepID=A0A955L346_9BACT|nr:hypothetical protein [Candidatus Dojkabacteria bacterium]
MPAEVTTPQTMRELSAPAEKKGYEALLANKQYLATESPAHAHVDKLVAQLEYLRDTKDIIQIKRVLNPPHSGADTEVETVNLVGRIVGVEINQMTGGLAITFKEVPVKEDELLSRRVSETENTPDAGSVDQGIRIVIPKINDKRFVDVTYLLENQHDTAGHAIVVLGDYVELDEVTAQQLGRTYQHSGFWTIYWADKMTSNDKESLAGLSSARDPNGPVGFKKYWKASSKLRILQ